MILPEPRLLVITDRRQARRPLEEVVEAVFAGGCRWLSLREKDLTAGARAALLARFVALGRRWDACVGVHEDIAAAAATGAAALHLPDGVTPAGARAHLAARVLVGRSAHDAAGVVQAAGAGLDYVTLSPIFASRSKPGYGPALGPAQLAAATAAAAIPVIALGGVDAGNAGACIAAGADGIAVMGAVMAADDPAAAVRALISSVRAALVGRGDASHSQGG